MQGLEPTARDSVPAASPRSRAINLTLFALGLLLFAAAIWVVLRQEDALRGALEAAKNAPLWLVIALALLPLCNWALTSSVFWLLTRRFGRVGWGEMSMLIGCAWLLNMLPLKPGLVGRVAYHKAVSGIQIRHSILVVLVALFTGGFGIVLTLVGSVIVSGRWQWGLAWGVIAGIAACSSIGYLIARRFVAPRLGVAEKLPFQTLALCVAIRMVETLVWAVRYFLALRLIGVEQDFVTCVLLSGISQLAGQLPVQLGLREWAVGAGTTALAPVPGSSIVQSAVPGLQADIVNRAAEILCALPVGLASFIWLSRRLRMKGHG